MSDRPLFEKAAYLLPVLLCLVVAACAQAKPGLLELQPPAKVEELYRIRPGDELEIRFFHTPENDVLLPVRPDGFISLPLVHELKAAGHTVEELRQELLKRYRTELTDPELVVIVRTFTAYPVHVGGEVDSPGMLELTGSHNVLEAVFAAGGFLASADLSEVLVVRRADGRGYEILEADLEALLKGRDASGNFLLHPYDIVFVPSSPIAEVNQWVDQYLLKNIPVRFSATYRLDDL